MLEVTTIEPVLEQAENILTEMRMFKHEKGWQVRSKRTGRSICDDKQGKPDNHATLQAALTGHMFFNGNALLSALAELIPFQMHHADPHGFDSTTATSTGRPTFGQPGSTSSLSSSSTLSTRKATCWCEPLTQNPLTSRCC